jgi:ribonuclease VapC
MFVDASAIVAILTNEPEAEHFAAALAAASHRFTSGLVVLEAAAQLAHRLDIDPVEVESRIQQVLDEARISVVPINAGIARRAVAAFATYGKGRDHPAQLSLADCMSYACARTYRVPILARGGGFAQTDIAVA